MIGLNYDWKKQNYHFFANLLLLEILLTFYVFAEIGPKPWSISCLRIGMALEQAWRILSQIWGFVLFLTIVSVPITKSVCCLYFSSKTFALTRLANLSLSASNCFRSLCHSGSLLSPMAFILDSRSMTFKRVLSW